MPRSATAWNQYSIAGILLALTLCTTLRAEMPLVPPPATDDLKILINQIGYEPDAPKRAVILGHPTDEVTGLAVFDDSTRKQMLSVPVAQAGRVDQWKDWCFWSADFSALHVEGTYFLECSTGKGRLNSFPFVVQNDLLERNTLSNVIYYFKGHAVRACWTKRIVISPFKTRRVLPMFTADGTTPRAIMESIFRTCRFRRISIRSRFRSRIGAFSKPTTN